MPKAEKIERVGELRERIEGSDALLLTEYRGLTVSDITELRRSLAEGGAGFAVVKNTLMRRAAADASIAELEALLDGPTAVAFVIGDPVAAAKKISRAAAMFVSAQSKFLSLLEAYKEKLAPEDDTSSASAEPEPTPQPDPEPEPTPQPTPEMESDAPTMEAGSVIDDKTEAPAGDTEGEE